MDGKVQVLRARAKECENHEGLVQELLGCNRFAVAYRNVSPENYRLLKTGDARPYHLQQAERELRAVGPRPGTEQRGFTVLDSDHTPRQTLRTANLAPTKKTQNPGPIASADSCRAAGLEPGATVAEVLAAFEAARKRATGAVAGRPDHAAESGELEIGKLT